MAQPSSSSSLQRFVFVSSSLVILLMVLFTALMPQTSGDFFNALQANIVGYASWFYVLAVSIITVTVIYVAFSRYGEIRLGPEHSVPEYSYSTWFAMLFSAGMGIGLMFFGVAEPVMHFLAPPLGEGGTVDAAREAMNQTFFHWGLHAWAIYAIVGLVLAYFGFRQGLPLTLRSAFYPIFGKKIFGRLGDAIDIFAIIGTVLGVATSLGYGVSQINSGLNHIFGLPNTTTMQVIILITITLIATLSVSSGLNKGIRILSETNLFLAAGLLLFILVSGSTVMLLQTFIENAGIYFSDIVSKTFLLYAYEPTDWIGGWTIFYWGWWISWSPFVGLFIARISRGRTIREFCIGVTLVPMTLTFFWMTVFGNSAIDLILNQGATELASSVQQDTTTSLFSFLSYFPFSGLISILAIVMVIIFFVTSADSGALVVNMIASKGKDNTPLWRRIYWTFLIGLVACVLLLAGGLGALQTATIASALPFTIILLVAIYGLFKALRIESIKRVSLLHSMNTAPPKAMEDEPDVWKERVKVFIETPREKGVRQFIASDAKNALSAICKEFNENGVEAVVKNKENAVLLIVPHLDDTEFVYGVNLQESAAPTNLYQTGKTIQEQKSVYRAEVFLNEGGQGYDIMGYSKQQIITDVLDQYEKHLHFLAMLS